MKQNKGWKVSYTYNGKPRELYTKDKSFAVKKCAQFIKETGYAVMVEW